jgi:Holliday junction DNA helicase RuvA
VLHHIRGEVIAHTPGEVIVETGGLGYRVQVSLRTAETLPSEGQIHLYLYQQVREDGISLFGFATPAERSVFEHLLQVKGVGAKLALKILSTYSPAQVVRVVSAGDVPVLQRVKGLGHRKAELVVATLRNALPEVPDDLSGTPGAAEPPLAAESLAQADAILGLCRLGYTRKQAESAVRSAARRLGASASLEDLIRESLRQ